MRVKNQLRISGRMNASTINNHDLARYEARSNITLPNPIQQDEMQHLYFHSSPNRFNEPQSGKTMAPVPATSTASAEEKTCFPVTKPSWAILRRTRCTCPGAADEEAAFYTSFRAFVISDTGTMMQSGADLNWNWKVGKSV